MFGFNTTELLIVLGIFVLLFGAARLPALMRSLGRSVNEFKHGLRDEPAEAKVLDDREESGR
jgi:sec-independent protein translocase protein TatA